MHGVRKPLVFRTFQDCINSKYTENENINESSRQQQKVLPFALIFLGTKGSLTVVSAKWL